MFKTYSEQLTTMSLNLIKQNMRLRKQTTCIAQSADVLGKKWVAFSC